MKRIYSISLILLIWLSSCTAPRYFWPQKDINVEEINQSSLDKKILITSRNTEFKNAVLQKPKEAFQDQDIYIKIIGINDLKDEDPNKYSATVIINTTMGWRIDKKVESFLKKYGKLGSIIVITTSAGDDILPDLEGRNIDVISTALVIDKTDEIADSIISKISRILENDENNKDLI